MKSFGSSVRGKKFKSSKAVFKIIGINSYSKDQVSKRFKEILSFGSGVLVAVNYRGVLIPNITIRGGVVRLTEVEVGGKIYKTPKAISEAIGINAAMKPYKLTKA